MKTLDNQNELSSSFLFYIEQKKSIYNESISFLCVIQGDLRLSCREYEGEMRQGDLILLKETGRYRVDCRERSLFLLVCFDYIFFTEQFGDDFERLECCSAKYPELPYETLRSALIKLAVSHTANRRDNRFLIQNQIFHLFHLLKMDFLTAFGGEENPGLSAKQSMRLKQFSSYLKANYMSPLTLQGVADYMNYTPQYLSNFIKKNLGCTFNTCLNRLRLNAAVNYLKFRDLSLEQISLTCGFANPASFVRVFQKEYLTTPEQFRKDYKSSSDNDLEGISLFSEPAFIRDYLQGSLQAASAAPLSAIENIVTREVACNAAETTPLHPVWQELINLGSAANFENPTFRSHIAAIQQTLRFRYGRITDILSVVSTYTAENRKYEFNFSKVFLFLDFCLNLGLKPLLELGDKAPDIYLPAGRVTIDDDAELDALYHQLIPALISGCVDHYGFDEVSSWKFELWMRYGNRSMTRLEAPQSYFNRFQNVYRAIKAIVPDAPVGAPGFNTFSSMDHLEKVLALFHQKGLYPDFISAYIYPFAMPESYEDEDNMPVLLQENADFFRQKIAALRQACARHHMEHLPLYITEFSTHIAFDNYFNDSTYQAAFIVKQYLDNWRQAEAMGYWLASDYSVEYPNCTQFLSGGNGIVSQNGIPKPGFHAFRFLFSLGCDLIAQDEHYIVTHSIDERYQVLIHNYAHFTEDFCRHLDRYELLKYPDAALEEIPPFQLTLQLGGLSSGVYKISRYLEDGEHGSVFHKWRKMNFIESLNEAELGYLKNICVPDLFVWTQEVTDSLTLSEKIGKNEICLFNIEKIS